MQKLTESKNFESCDSPGKRASWHCLPQSGDVAGIEAGRGHLLATHNCGVWGTTQPGVSLGPHQVPPPTDPVLKMHQYKFNHQTGNNLKVIPLKKL